MNGIKKGLKLMNKLSYIRFCQGLPPCNHEIRIGGTGREIKIDRPGTDPVGQNSMKFSGDFHYG